MSFLKPLAINVENLVKSICLSARSSRKTRTALSTITFRPRILQPPSSATKRRRDAIIARISQRATGGRRPMAACDGKPNMVRTRRYPDQAAAARNHTAIDPISLDSKHPGLPPPALEARERIASILAAIETAHIMEAKFKAMVDQDVLARQFSGELDTDDKKAQAPRGLR